MKVFPQERREITIGVHLQCCIIQFLKVTEQGGVEKAIFYGSIKPLLQIAQVLPPFYFHALYIGAEGVNYSIGRTSVIYVGCYCVCTLSAGFLDR